jgi:hypothetical protein
MVEMTQYQIETWTRVPLAINTQPDISNTGNRECLDMAVRAGSWLRSDSIVFIEEPIQIECKGIRRPVNWACAQPLNEDGSLTIQLKTFDEKG